MTQTNQINILKLLPKQSQPITDVSSLQDSVDAGVADILAQQSASAAELATTIGNMDINSFEDNSVSFPPGTTEGDANDAPESFALPSEGNPDADPPTRGTTVNDFTTNYFSNIQSQIENDPNLASFAALEEANVKLPSDILMTPEKLPEVIAAAQAPPQPTTEQFQTFIKYNSNGIFYKSNLSAVMKRDNKGSIILNIGNNNGI